MKIEDIQVQPFFCSQSSTKTALGCERKWFLGRKLGLGLKGIEIKESADLGQIYHKFQQFGPGNEAKVQAWVTKRQANLMQKIDKGEDLDGQMARLVNSLTVSTHKAEAMAKIFWEKYSTPDYLKVLGVEIKYRASVTLKNPNATIGGCPTITIQLEGTIDKLIQDTRNNNIWIRDHKSTGRPLELLFNGFPWSIQARIYRILMTAYCQQNKILGKITGFILDGILKPGIKLCGKDNKNAAAWNCTVDEAYLRRVKDWYKGKEAENEGSTVKSQSIMFNEPLVSAELQRDLLKMHNLSKRDNDPRSYNRDESRSHCSVYEKPCIYMSLCSTPITQWPELIDDKYKVKKVESVEVELTASEKIANQTHLENKENAPVT